MRGHEGEPGFREKVGDGFFKGGIIAGAIGLLVSGELLLVGMLAAAGGMAIKGSGKNG